MTTKDKYYIEVETAFKTADEKKIIHKLNDIKKNGKPIVIPLIVALLEHEDCNEAIEKIILETLGQLKNKECIPYIIKSFDDVKLDSTKKKIIMTCWQSGLDYSAHIVVFANEFIKGSYETAIEAFTVIEEWIHASSKEQITECKNFLKENISTVKEDKKAFYLELVKFVDSHL